MKVLFYLGHPAHYHNISTVLPELKEKGHDVLLVARDKDVLFQLLDGTPYRTIHLTGRKSTKKWKLILNIIQREWKMLRIAWKEKPDIMVGTDIVITHVGNCLNIPSLVINEDDSKAVPQLAHLGFKYATRVLSPRSCDITPYEKKKIEYEGYQELAYLHPNEFTPDRSRIEPYIPGTRPTFLLRFSSLTAHHDEGIEGMDADTIKRLIEILEPEGTVLITSEKELDPQLETYRCPIPVKDIHHVLYFADLLIGDSQTMTAEAAVLGTPSVRVNDFVGKLGYLEELEHTYGLTYGFRPKDKEKALKKVEELLQHPELQEEWQEKRRKMLTSTANVKEVLTKAIEELGKGSPKK